MSTNGGDSIFGRRRRSGFSVYMILLAIISFSVYLMMDERVENLITKNQQNVLGDMQLIRSALNRWKKGDYDANGKNDLPLCSLDRLYNTRLINGQPLHLIPERLVMADLRNKSRVASNGYFFTLTNPRHPWPEDGLVDEVMILAVPEKVDQTGCCTFYLHVDGQMYYTDLQLEDKIPVWPDAAALEAGIWFAL